MSASGGTGPVDAVVFDVGNVLLAWDPRRVYADEFDDPAELQRFLSEVCTTEWNLELDAGRPFDDAAAALIARHPQHAARIRMWQRQDEMIAGVIGGTVEIARALLARGTGCYLLTNMPAPVFERRRERYRCLQLFCGAVVSGAEGVVKPDPEIFRRLCARYDLDPSRTLFVDDAPVNVAAARELSFQTHRFTDPESLRSDLVGRGLLEPRHRSVGDRATSPPGT